VVARSDHDYMDLFDSDHQKVTLDSLHSRVPGQATFKALTAEGRLNPATAQPGQLPSPKPPTPPLQAHREAQEALDDFQRCQQRMFHTMSMPKPTFTGGRLSRENTPWRRTSGPLRNP
jgi:hypothetical protein